MYVCFFTVGRAHLEKTNMPLKNVFWESKNHSQSIGCYNWKCIWRQTSHLVWCLSGFYKHETYVFYNDKRAPWTHFCSSSRASWKSEIFQNPLAFTIQKVCWCPNKLFCLCSPVSTNLSNHLFCTMQLVFRCLFCKTHKQRMTFTIKHSLLVSRRRPYVGNHKSVNVNRGG